MARLILHAPAAGWVCPLAEVADEAFSGGMMGDGVALDPIEGLIRAPCDAVVHMVAPTRHAVTLRTEDDVDILIHVGIDTVALDGEGFEVLVTAGVKVRTGAPLIALNLDLVARRARSLITPIICLSNGLSVVRCVHHRQVQAGDMLMEVVRKVGAEGDARAQVAAKGREVRRTATMALAHGLHARPAGKIAATARSFAAQIRFSTGTRDADARSSVALMALALRWGDRVELIAEGPDAAAAVAALAEMLESGMGEAAAAPGLRSLQAPAAVVPLAYPSIKDGSIVGAIAAPGLAIGAAWRMVASEVVVETASRGPALEQAALQKACVSARTNLTVAMAVEHGPRRAVLEAHLEFVNDPGLIKAASAAINEGASAGVAWRVAIQSQIEALNATGDSRMIERAADLRDLGARVLRALRGDVDAAPVVPPAGTILLAEELWPSQLIALDTSKLAGLCTANGGPTSHVAILAAAMGLPALVAAGPRVLDIANGQMLVLDADAGRLHPAPGQGELKAAYSRLAERTARRTAARAAAAEPAVTRDGAHVKIFANVGVVSDAKVAANAGAEGVGLLRTEFLFLERTAAPDEDEQAAAYQAVADAMGGRPVIVRTLDIGGDKPAPYLALPREENPALGLRGVRVGLRWPDMLSTQLRAILRVQPIGVCRIMLPMVASLSELRQVRILLDAARGELGVEGPVELGIMVETPAAAVTADLLAKEADFLSIGTNDLAQYVLALDRGHSQLAGGGDALHPAVLRMIARTCEGATANGRWTGVCGGLASDPLATPILLGLGVGELSCTPTSVPEIKARVRDLSLKQCRELARHALDLSSAAEVRAWVRAALTEGRNP